MCDVCSELQIGQLKANHFKANFKPFPQGVTEVIMPPMTFRFGNADWKSRVYFPSMKSYQNENTGAE